MLKGIGAEVQRTEVLNYKVKEGQKMRGANVKYKRGAEMQRCSFRGAGGKGCRGVGVQRCRGVEESMACHTPLIGSFRPTPDTLEHRVKL